VKQTRLRIFFLTVMLASVSCVVAAAQDATITYATGQVSINRGGTSLSADIGASVRQADLVQTGADGLCIVRLNGNTEIKIREQSSVRISDLSQNASVELESGSLFSRIVGRLLGRYTVKAGGVVAGVRGTEFFVAYGRTIEEKPDIWLCVNSGTVAVDIPETGESTDVSEGEGVNVLSGVRLTVPRPYEWTKDLNWNMDPSQGPVEDNTDLDRAYSDLLDQDYD